MSQSRREELSQPSVDDSPQELANVPSPRDDWKPPTREALLKELEAMYPSKKKKRVWQGYNREVKNYYDTLLKRWQKEMDNLLVFGGLFAAVLTPFNVESYTSLQPDPTDPSLAILQQISAQLNNSAFTINSTTPSLPQADIRHVFYPSESAVLVNELWFSSLICTLASTSIALIVKQWLHDLSAKLTGTSRQVARRRQYRYNAMRKWHIRIIILIPSLLLQTALILFLSGLLVFLWNLHFGVAIVSSALAGALFLFLVVVTLLPVFFSDCCYGSAQVRVVFPIARWILHKFIDFLCGVLRGLAPICGPVFKRLYRFLVQASLTIRSSTWRTKEELPVMREAKTLDSITAAMAFTTTLSTKYLRNMGIVLQDLPAKEITLLFDTITKALPSGTDPSHLISDPRRTVAKLLTFALRYLVYNIRSSADIQADEAAYLSLLDRLEVTDPQVIDQNAVIDLVFHINHCRGSYKLTQRAYELLLKVLKRVVDNAIMGRHFTYRSLRYAMLMLEEDMDPQQQVKYKNNYDFVVTRQLQTVQGVLHCVLHSLARAPETTLTSAQAAIIRDHGKRLISQFDNNWAKIDWRRLSHPSVDPSPQPPPSLSGDIFQFAWMPLQALIDSGNDDDDVGLISETMVTTLSTALSAFRAANGRPFKENEEAEKKPKEKEKTEEEKHWKVLDDEEKRVHMMLKGLVL